MDAPVIGAHSLLTALGTDARAILDAIAAGRSALAPAANRPDAPLLARLAEDPEGIEDDPALRILGPHGRTLEPVMRALHQSVGADQLPAQRVGLHIGMGAVDSAVRDLVAPVAASRNEDGALDLRRFFARGYKLLHPLWPLSMLNNVAAGQIATDLNVRGDNLVMSATAADGARALLEGARAVRVGVVDGTLAAGVAEPLGPAARARRRRAGPLATREEPSGQRPGEGAAALWLERAADARAAGRPADMCLAAGATTFGRGDHAGALARAIRLALERAVVAPADLSLVVLQQPGAPLDAPEQEAVAAVLGTTRYHTLAPSLALGDLGPAAPALQCVLAATWLRDADVPSGRSALITSLASSGSAAALIITATHEGSDS